MENIDNNQFEVKPTNSKRKIIAPCPNVYLNPALDLLANEDRICNTAMEIVPNKKRKRTKSLDIITFDNSALDSGLRKATKEFLVREIENVKRNVKPDLDVKSKSLDKNFVLPENCDCTKISLNLTEDTFNVDKDYMANVNNLTDNNISDQNNSLSDTVTEINSNIDFTNPSIVTEPIYANLTEVATVNTTNNESDFEITDISKINHEDFDSGISVLEQKNIYNVTNIQTVNNTVFNNSNLSFIERLALDSPNVTDGSLVLDDDLNESNIMEIKTITIITKKKRIIEKNNTKAIETTNTNPFLDPNLNVTDVNVNNNPFLDMTDQISSNLSTINSDISPNVLIPRRLFASENSTISSSDSLESQHEYENVDNRAESPIYENIEELNFNKQSKVLGYDVSQLSASDILNLHTSNESNEAKKSKNSILKVGKKMFKSFKKTFRNDKVDTNLTLNPYEVPRKQIKVKKNKESGIENPALNLDNSDDLEIEELSDDEHHYETVKTLRNTKLNMNVTPLRVKDNDLDFSHKTNTPGKKVRFDSTLNQEKVITGNSFDYDLQSPGFDAKIDKYHDELENCINERKFLQQNM